MGHPAPAARWDLCLKELSQRSCGSPSEIGGHGRGNCAASLVSFPSLNSPRVAASWLCASIPGIFGTDTTMTANPNPWQVGATIRKAYTKKYCLAPDAGESTCSGGIVKAHSVQEALLRKIARYGHVYRADTALENYHKNPGRITYKLVGVNLASSFTGFCNLHDTKIFAPLETASFAAGPEPCFLLAYRAVCREVFVKRAVLENAEWLVRNAPAPNLELATANLALTKVAIRDLEWHKNAYDRDLRTSNFGAIEWVCIELSSTPDLACSGLCHPDYDFAGKKLQDLSDLKTRMELVTFSVIPTDQGGAIVFAWHSTSGRTGWQLVASLGALDNSLLPHAIVRFAFSYSDNLCLSPAWWDSLPADARNALQRRSFVAASPDFPADGTWLLDDGLRLVNWPVGRR